MSQLTENPPSAISNQQFELLPAGAHRSNSDDWFFVWNCPPCRDSGIALRQSGPPGPCDECQSWSLPISARVYGAIAVLLLKQKPVDKQMLEMARALVSASIDAPLQGEALASLLTLSERDVKGLAKRLRDEWRLPVVGRREKPYGYFFATAPEEFLAWMRTTRSQAISELATAFHLFRACFPELAGQEQFEFVKTVSTELQAAIRS